MPYLNRSEILLSVAFYKNITFSLLSKWCHRFSMWPDQSKTEPFDLVFSTDAVFVSACGTSFDSRSVDFALMHLLQQILKTTYERFCLARREMRNIADAFASTSLDMFYFKEMNQDANLAKFAVILFAVTNSRVPQCLI